MLCHTWFLVLLMSSLDLEQVKVRAEVPVVVWQSVQYLKQLYLPISDLNVLGRSHQAISDAVPGADEALSERPPSSASCVGDYDDDDGISTLPYRIYLYSCAFFLVYILLVSTRNRHRDRKFYCWRTA